MFSPQSHPAHTPTMLDGEVRYAPLGKQDALSLFIELQRLGLFPYMEEENDGRFRVGHTRNRLSI